ncbi:MAG: hypothetical protein JNL74_14645 [Fibrobacteres bacterium]|nr:hypothetical protein [Fibrobacterota bacterium]
MKKYLIVLLFAAVCSADSTITNTVVFMGLESIAENRFHKTLEERIYSMFSYDKSITLQSADYYDNLNKRGYLSRKLISVDEAVALMKSTGVRLFISGEIRDFRISLKRRLGILPWGIVKGEIVCYIQVIDASERRICFAGNLKYSAERSAGFVGYGRFRGERPLSPLEEKHFVFDLTTGLGESIVKTSQASYAGIFSPENSNSSKRLQKRFVPSKTTAPDSTPVVKPEPDTAAQKR